MGDVMFAHNGQEYATRIGHILSTRARAKCDIYDGRCYDSYLLERVGAVDADSGAGGRETGE